MANHTPQSKTTLSSEAYRELPPGQDYAPVIPATLEIPELTIRSLGVGVLVAIVFGAANAYLGLKVGLTVSASIPAAVAGVAVFQALRRSGNPLEINIVQTIGSSGEALAAGVIFTLPVLYLWGETPGFWPIFPLSLLGGLLGILFMIPLRRLLIVQEHGRLTYPEGTACAEVIVAAQSEGRQARLLFTGMGVGGLYSGLQKLGRLWPSEPDIALNQAGFRTSVGADVTPELLGVGYIIGPRVAAVLLAGGAVGWLVLIPLIYLFGSAATIPIPPESTVQIAEMDSFTVWGRYIRYIGAGAVGFGGLLTLAQSAPTLWESVQVILRSLRQPEAGPQKRTDQDLPLTLVIASLLVIGLLVAFLPLRMGDDSLGILAALAVVGFSGFFVTVSSRIVGLIGNSSNPISGMAIATVLVCALLFGQAYRLEEARIAVLTIGSLVCIAAALAGDTSQDLKTGFLLGANPRNQQIAQVVSVVAAALTMSTVLALFQADIVSGAFKAPQANLIRLVIDGVLGGNLPWGLVLVGVALAACVEIMGLPTLAFAVGLYLPIHLSVPIMVGGLIRLGVERSHREILEHRQQRGILYASGLIAGGALVGVAAAFGEAVSERIAAFFSLPLLQGESPDPTHWGSATIAFTVLTATLVWITLGSSRHQRSP
jgi:putative OPT family oligopeptide transporter